MPSNADVTRIAKASQGAVLTFPRKKAVGLFKLNVFAAIVTWRVRRRLIVMRQPDDQSVILVLVQPPLWVYIKPGGLLRFLELSGIGPAPVTTAITRLRPRKRIRRR